MNSVRRPKLTVIPGGRGEIGPITRLGLWDKFQPTSKVLWFLILASKVALLLGIIYYFFR